MTAARRPVLLAALAVLAAPARAAEGLIRGTASYRERIALPPGAELRLELLDIARAGAPAERIAQATIPVQGQVPIAFELRYDPARITPAGRYALRAVLAVQGQPAWHTDTIHPVLTQGAGETVELRLVRLPSAGGAATPPDPRSLVGPAWRAEDITGRGVLDRVQPSLGFTPEGQARGHGGCNAFSGGYTAEGAALGIGPLAATMMACEGAIGEQEQRFFAALAEVRGWRLDRGLLHLTDAAGATLIRLAR